MNGDSGDLFTPEDEGDPMAVLSPMSEGKTNLFYVLSTPDANHLPRRLQKLLQRFTNCNVLHTLDPMDEISPAPTPDANSPPSASSRAGKLENQNVTQ